MGRRHLCGTSSIASSSGEKGMGRRAMAVGGGSADRRAEELAASGDPAAAAWAAGAAGERRVAGELANLREAWMVLHDRLLRPGQSEANLDHVVVGPGGVFLVDAKNWGGNVTEYEGGLYQHVGPAGARTSHSKHGEIAKVHGMAAYMAVESGMPVTPVICLAGPNEADFGEPKMLRGVWVVPVSKIVAWLGSRPPVFDRETAARAVTRAMTSFPSTTTDPDLLAAIGAAAAATKPRRRRDAGRSRPSAPKRASAGRPAQRAPIRTRPPLAARIGRFIGSLFLVALVLSLLVAFVPKLLTVGVERLARSAPEVTTPGATASVPTRTASPTAPRSKTAKPLGPPDCSTASGPQIAKIVGRKVQPIAVASGCSWGARLDDPSTTLVAIRMSASHAAYDMQLETSVKQRRVVFSDALDARYRPATALWVAGGQPITKGKVIARADTHVVISTKTLDITDDQARRMALAIAAAANAAG
jgi:hypothetical protein